MKSGINEKVKVRGVGRTETEPLNCIDPDSFYIDWEANSTWSLQFTAHDDHSFAYSMLDSQASIFFDGQEYIIKQAEPDANSGSNSIDVVATHVYFEVARIRKYKTYVDPADADKQTDVKVYGSTQTENDSDSDNTGDDSGDDSGDDDPNAQKTVTTSTSGNTTTKTTVTKTDETKEDSEDENQIDYHVEDVLKHWIDGNNLGFTYQVIGDFPTARIEELSDGSGTDMLSKITEHWPNAIIYPDNKNIRVYSQDQFYKDHNNRLDYEYNTTEFKWTYDSTSLTNEIMCIGGKYSIETEVDTSTSGDDSHGSGGAGADKVVNDAKKYLGIPYVWGGHNKSNPQAGMDCSGFVSQVYYDFGINLPVNTVAMEPYFHEIPREQIQTGDVGFYGPHGGTYHICLILNKSTDIYEPQPGQSCMTQNIDAFPPHWYARNDQMASIVAGDSDSGGDTTSESSSSTSSEFYYFAPFMYRDEESIKKYGEYPAEPFEDGRFSDKNAMIEAAKAKIQPDPALSVEVTTYSNFKPVAGDMIHIMVKEQSICTNEAVVGFNWYPYSATNPTSVTLNSNSQNILDYQHSRQVALTDAINSVRQDAQKSIEASSQANQIGGDKKLFTWLKEYAG